MEKLILVQPAARSPPLHTERPGHTSKPIALLDDAYLKLTDKPPRLQNRAHFFALSAQLMRRIMVDHTRQQALNAAETGR